MTSRTFLAAAALSIGLLATLAVSGRARQAPDDPSGDSPVHDLFDTGNEVKIPDVPPSHSPFETGDEIAIPSGPVVPPGIDSVPSPGDQPPGIDSVPSPGDPGIPSGDPFGLPGLDASPPRPAIGELVEEIRRRRSEDQERVESVIEQLRSEIEAKRQELARLEAELEQAESLLAEINGAELEADNLRLEPLSPPAIDGPPAIPSAVREPDTIRASQTRPAPALPELPTGPVAADPFLNSPPDVDAGQEMTTGDRLDELDRRIDRLIRLRDQLRGDSGG